MKTLLKKIAAVGLIAAGAAIATNASATQILAFGQTSQSNTITGTASAGVTTITGSDIAILISQIENGAPIAAFFTLNAHSTGPDASCLGGTAICQQYAGTFTITSGLGGTGTNFLSGSFNDGVLGLGTTMILAASTAAPGDAVGFTSDIITSLGLDRGIALSFANVSPPNSDCGGTLCSFTASVSGVFNGGPGRQVPEPISLGLVGIGLVGMGFARRRRS